LKYKEQGIDFEDKKSIEIDKYLRRNKNIFQEYEEN
jgi:hypothetical protein